MTQLPDMPDSPDVVVRDYPGQHLRMSFQASDEVLTQGEMAHLAVQALTAFGSGWWEPLSADLTLACCDSQTWYPLADRHPASPYRTLYAADVPAGTLLRSAWEKAREEVADPITEVALLKWMINPLDVPCPGDTEPAVVGWQELLVRAARVRLPNTLRPIRGGDLAVRSGAGVARIPLEIRHGEAWVAGPRSGRGDPPPVDLRIVHLSGMLTLEAGLHWSPWIDEAGNGADQIRDGVQRLIALGWQRQD